MRIEAAGGAVLLLFINRDLDRSITSPDVSQSLTNLPAPTGLKLATGETDEKSDEGERFETEFQPGSGSVDPIVGIAARRSWGRSSLTGSLLYTLAEEGAQDTDLGDQFDYGLAYSYRVSRALRLSGKSFASTAQGIYTSTKQPALSP